MALENFNKENTEMKLLKDLAFLGFIAVGGLTGVVVIMLIVPVLECLIAGKPFFNI